MVKIDKSKIFDDYRLVNEAYDLIKPHIKHIKNSLNIESVYSNIKLSKELTIHFFTESERCKINNRE
jgi:hypothetical protein